MSPSRSPTMMVRVRGDLAAFTEPAFKVERVSYPVMTPSAARGVLEAILWKPAIRWHVERIRVLKPIRFTAFRRNEVNSKAPVPTAAVVERGGSLGPFFADDDRAQRNTVALRDVDYVIEAYFALTDRSGPEDNVSKFVEMFQRRVQKGQHFHQPYLGCREFAADVLPADGAPEPIRVTRDLGIMLWGIEYGDGRNRPIFFTARLHDGVLEVPGDPEATLPTGSTKDAA
jgi:CRISPR-associated protein Cas5d